MRVGVHADRALVAYEGARVHNYDNSGLHYKAWNKGDKWYPHEHVAMTQDNLIETHLKE